MYRILLLVTLTLQLTACTGVTPEPMKTVNQLELSKFMGNWYVLADIATPFDKGARNPVEIYTRNADGTIATTYRFQRGEKVREMHAKAYVMDDSNAVWGMQFFWPIKADYRVVYLDEDYNYCIVGRNKRDFIWIMSRTTELEPGKFEELLQFAESLGYDRERLRYHYVNEIEEKNCAE